MQKENWKPIAGYEGLYEISDLGRVKSLARKARFGTRVRVIKEGILSPHEQYKGYLRVDLSKGGKATHHFVHRLVAMTFVPNPEGKPIANHLDGNKRNNRSSNFEWATDSENTQHYYDLKKSSEHARRATYETKRLPDVAFDDMLSHALSALA